MDKPQCVWNFDETSFPQDHTKKKAIGTRGTKTVRVTCGANRENITVLAACCADGTALPPLIVYKGKRVQSTWCAEEPIEGM